MVTCVQVDIARLRQRCTAAPSWVAPEVLRGDPPSCSSDVYSLAMVMYEMLYRREPFSGEGVEVGIFGTTLRRISNFLKTPK